MNNGPFRPCKGWQAWYAQDTGDDMGENKPVPIITALPGILIYSEGLMPGDRRHTPWVPSKQYPKDSPGCVLQLLTTPLVAYGKQWHWLWYCHLSQLAHHIRDGLDPAMKVGAGHQIGMMGWGRGVLHLHFGILLERSQGPGMTMPPGQVAQLVESWPLWKGQTR